MQLYPRGFVCSRRKLRMPDNLSHYAHRSVGGIHFYSDISTNTAVAIKNDKYVILHGHACLYSEGKMTNNTQEIADSLVLSLEFNDLQGLEHSLYWLGGRYAVVAGTDRDHFTVYHDAHGMRTVYFDQKNHAVASHMHLLEALFEDEQSQVDNGPLWANWDSTQNENILALIPNHRLNEATFTQHRYFPTESPAFSHLTDDARISLVEGLWKSQIDEYVKNNTIAMSITGGLDSRVTLAMTAEHHKGIAAFTYTHDTGEGPSAAAWKLDKEIVREILKILPLSHTNLRYEDRVELNADEIMALNQNTLGDHGRWLINLYRDVFANPDWLHLRSNTHETARAYYPRSLDEDQLQRIAQLVTRAKTRALNLDESAQEKTYKDSMHAIERFQYATESHWIEPLDLFYWEFRMGRWVSEVYNETDTVFETFTPFNMRAIIELSLGFSYEERSEGKLFRELINRSFPILNFFGINNKQNIYESQRENRLGEIQKATPPSQESAKESGEFKNACPPISFNILTTNNETIKLDSDCLFVPVDYLEKGNLAVVRDFLPPGDSVEIKYFNDLSKASARGYLQYEIVLNEKLLEVEDFTTSTGVSSLILSNPSEQTITFEFRIRVLRTCKAKSWQKASRTWIQSASGALEDLRIFTTISPSNALSRTGLSTVLSEG